MIEKIKEILSEFTDMDISSMNENMTLINDLGLNSLEVVNVVLAFEDEFGIEIPDRDIPGFQTIGDIIFYLEPVDTKS